MDLSYFETTNEQDEVSFIRPETKSREALERVISLTKPLAVVDKFISLYLVGIQWHWFASYQRYLIDVEAVNAHNANPPVTSTDEEGNDVLAEQKALPVEPVRPLLLTVEEFKADNIELFSSYLKQQGADIRGHQVSLNENNQNGIAAVLTGLKLAAEVGVDMFPMKFNADTANGNTQIQFGDLDEFKAFALNFMEKRQRFFK